MKDVDNAWEQAVGDRSKPADIESFTELHGLLPFQLPMELGKHVKMEDYLDYVKVQFASLAVFSRDDKVSPVESLSFDMFMKWGEIEDIISEGFLDKKQIEDAW